MITSFIARLMGKGAHQIEERKRFERSLEEFEAKGGELDAVEAELEGILTNVGQKVVAQRMSIPSNMSGEHRLNLGAPLHVRR